MVTVKLRNAGMLTNGDNKCLQRQTSVVVEQAFDAFSGAVTCKAIMTSFDHLLDVTGLRHVDHRRLYFCLQDQLKHSWRAQSLWAKIDKRAGHRDYAQQRLCKDTKVLIIGAGPCGLRVGIECALLGARTVVMEKRDRFSRNNVLHLWPYLIADLKNLGAKLFFGKFCAGSIDHISIRQLQCILLKVALLVGVEVHVNVAFESLMEPPDNQSLNVGWRCKCDPETHPVSEYQFDVLLGADGKRNTLSGFKRKEFRGKLAIAVTANFINRNTQYEACVEEISGVAFIFNQKFFLDLKDKTGIDLENIVYYKGDTHYFVMTAKKRSLLSKGVLKQDHSATVRLLDRENVDQEALMAYARQAADFSTDLQLPHLDYAVNHYGQSDVAMFDFTSMYAAENASRVVEKSHHRLLMGLVGDSLLEPFWPTGSGCARGFLGALDAAWMVRSWASGRMTPLEVIAERESVYTLLSQTTPVRLHKNYHQYCINPNTRYPNLNMSCIKPHQVQHLFNGYVDPKEMEEVPIERPAKRPCTLETGLNIDSYSLLRWYQRVLNTGSYGGVHVTDFTSSWRSGLAFCALIDTFRPSLLDCSCLNEQDVAQNNQLAYDTAARELDIAPVMTGEEMAGRIIPDKLTMIVYLTQFYELFKHEPLPPAVTTDISSNRRYSRTNTARSPNRRLSVLSKVGARISTRSKKRKDPDVSGSVLKKIRDDKRPLPPLQASEPMSRNKLPMDEIANRLQQGTAMRPQAGAGFPADGGLCDAANVNVHAMAEVLVAKFLSYADKPVPPPVRHTRMEPKLLAAHTNSELCFFCGKRVYIMERQGAEGVFFHRQCLRCAYCDVSLRINSYFHERRTDGTVRFYCYRHFSRQMRTRPPCKRHLGTSDGEIKGNLPKANVIPASGFDGRQSSLQTAHCGIIASRLSIPGDSLDAPDRTPERIGFEISFDGQESESEERQFDHNLGASTCSNGSLCVSDDDDDDLGLDGESSSGDDIFNSTNDTLSATFTKSLTKEEIVRLSDSWKRQHSVPIGRRCPSDGKDDDDESFDNYVSARCSLGEAGVQSSSEGGDSDDVLTTPYDNSSETLNKGKLFAGSTADSVKDSGPNSASCPAVSSSVRASFFSAPPTVVRLDPSRMFTDRDGTLDLTDIGPAALKTHKQRDTEAGGVEVCLNEVDVGVDDLSSEADHQSERVPLLTVDGSFGDSADDELDSAEEDVMNKETDTSDKRQLLSSGFGDETFVVAVPTTCSVNVGQQQEFVISGSTASFPLVASYDLYDQFGVGSITGSGLLDSVLRSLESLRESSTDDDTCQQVLKDVAVMPEVSSAERNPDRCFKGIDDRFVTDRRRCKKMSFLHPPGTGSAVGSYSDITISASSPSMSSLSSSPDEVVDHSQQAGVCVRRVSSPDCDMKEDCLATMSRVLREDLICEVESFGSTDPCDELCHTLKVNDVGQAVVGKQELSGDKSHVFSGWETLSKMAQSIADPGGAECACEANNGAKHTHMQTTDVPIGGVSPPDNDTSVFFPSSLNVARFCSPPLGKSAANTPAIRTAMAIHEPVLSALSARRRTTRATVIESLDVSLQAKQRADGSDTLKSLIENHLSGTPASVDYYDIVANMSTLDDVYSCMLNKGALTTKASCVEEGPIPFNSFIDHHSSVAVHPRTSVVSDVDDIPYADESEVEERFHTTASSVNSLPKPARLLAASMSVGDGSLVASSAPVNILPVTSVHQIHDVQYADQSCVLRLARDVVQSKTDIRFGDNVIVNPSYRMSAAVSVASPPATAPFGSVAAKLRRRSGAFKHIKPRRPNGLSIDASSNSDLPSEGDDDTADNLETPDGNPLRKNGDIVALLGMKDKETKKSRKSVLPTAPKVKTHKSGASASSRLADDALGCGAGRKMKKHRRSLLSSILNRSDKSGDNLRDMLLESQSSEHVCENLASEISVLKVSPLSTAARTDFTAERYGGHQVSSETVALNVAVTLPAEIAPTAHAEHYLSEAEEPGTTGGHCEVSPIGRPSERGAHKLLRQLRRIEQRRMQTAQEIQRQLEEVDERQRELEDCGIAVEKALRDDDSVAEADEAKLMGEWFSLVREKNGLVRYESELMVRAKELELEDRQSQLQATFHECSMKREKSKDDIDEEGRLLEELLDVVEQRNVLVAMLEDERLRERQQDEDLELTMVDKGYSLSPITMSSPGADISLSDT